MAAAAKFLGFGGRGLASLAAAANRVPSRIDTAMIA